MFLFFYMIRYKIFRRLFCKFYVIKLIVNFKCGNVFVYIMYGCGVIFYGIGVIL